MGFDLPALEKELVLDYYRTKDGFILTVNAEKAALFYNNEQIEELVNQFNHFQKAYLEMKDREKLNTSTFKGMSDRIKELEGKLVAYSILPNNAQT